LKIKPDFSDF